MKKVKNIELEKNVTSKKNIKNNKIKKNKQKDLKNLKDAVSKVKNKELGTNVQSTLELGIDGADKNMKRKIKNTEQLQKTVNKENKPVKEKDGEDLKNAEKKKSTETSVPSKKENKELTEADIKKIEKKKAKKLAQKLKKQKKKKGNLADDTTEEVKNNNAKPSKLEEKQKRERKPVENEQNITISVINENKRVKLDKSGGKKVYSTSNKVISKKEKKLQNKQLLEEQKLTEKQIRNPATEEATVFVGNLPVNTKRLQIIRLFKDYGPVTSIRLRSAGGQILHKHKQRRMAGSLNAYVVLKNKETAEKSIILNGTEFKGNHLRVTLAAKSPQKHAKEEAKRTVFVGNLKYSATEESLHEIFGSCGEIDYVRCLRDGDKGCKGVAYVCFKAADAVGLALELNETVLDDRPMHVERYSIKKLGAKETREANLEKEANSKKGAKQRIDKKNKKGKSLQKKDAKNEEDSDKKAKKSEFRGVKVESLKKKDKLKKKKCNNKMLQLAKKIAPKLHTE